jgi:putative serine protease PepD
MKNCFVRFVLFAVRRYVWPTSSQRSNVYQPLHKKHSSRYLWLLSITMLLVAACSAAVAQSLPTATPERVSLPTYTPTPAGSPSLRTGADIAEIDAQGLDIAERRVVDVYARVAPAVVNITTKTLRRSFFFDVVPEEGAGSGFVLDKAGHILTNYHVINGAEHIEVSFSDQSVVDAQVIGADPRNDIAVLKVAADPALLAPVTLGDSSSLQVGQRAIAIGNPFGQFGLTLTTGVISALNRSLEGTDGRTITGVIQTDAAINRGNSGGPLLDSSGRVIGINSAIFSPTGTNAGVGFAVPIDKVKRLLPDLLALGHYRHPWLGIRYAYQIVPSLAEALSLPVNKGVLLVQLYPNSPLEQANIQGAQQETVVGNQIVYVGGDILLSVDGVEVTSTDMLETLLEDKYQVGHPVKLTLMRNGQKLEITVKLGAEPIPG